MMRRCPPCMRLVQPCQLWLLAALLAAVHCSSPFAAIRLHVDTSLIATADADRALCSIGTGRRVCDQVGDIICDADELRYVCTEDDLLNATTRGLALGAFQTAFDTLQVLEVYPSGSAGLAATQNCANGFSLASFTNVDHVVFLTMRPTNVDTNPFPGRAIICNFSSVDGRPISSTINIPPRSTGDAPTVFAATVLRLVVQSIGFDLDAVGRYLAVYDDNMTMRTYQQQDPTTYPNGPLRFVAADGVTPVQVSGVGASTIIDGDLSTKTSSAVRMQLLTPNVRAEARGHFQCSSVQGVLLEELFPEFMRWERRVLNFEVMTSEFLQPTAAPVLSAFTIAAFKDMGFYRVSASGDAIGRDGSYVWGLHMGCGFLEQCSVEAWKNAYCNGTYGVGYDALHWGTCNPRNYDEVLAAAYRHFPEPSLGGVDIYADYCPYVPNTGAMPCTVADNGAVENGVGDVLSNRTCSMCRAVRRSIVSQRFALPDRAVVDNTPQCMEVVCLNTSHMAVRVGDRYLTCTEGSTVELTFPPSQQSAVVADGRGPLTDDPFFDYAFYGEVQCPAVAYLCQPGLGDLSPYRTDPTTGITLTASSWPEILGIEPRSGTVEGGVSLTITGKNFRRTNAAAQLDIVCRGLWIGGQPTDFDTFYYVGEDGATGIQTFTVNTSALPQTQGDEASRLGGEGDDGSGVVDVALLCRIAGYLECSTDSPLQGFCALSTVHRAFTLTPIPPPPPETYFLSEWENQLWIGVTFLAVLGLVLIIMYWYCRSSYAAPNVVTLAKLADERSAAAHTEHDDGLDIELMQDDAISLQELGEMAEAAEHRRQ